MNTKIQTGTAEQAAGEPSPAACCEASEGTECCEPPEQASCCWPPEVLASGL
jgi:hypothetical protein